MLEFMPEEILALYVDPIEDVKAPLMPRLYAREFETGVYALNGIASDVRFVAVGSRARPDLKMLKGAGCDLVQGYYFSRPLPPEEFESLIVKEQQIERENGA